jgi:hypothetical protein
VHNQKLIEILTEGEDGAVAIATQGADGPHVVNTWNSYVIIDDEGRLLIPAGRMQRTEENLGSDDRIVVTIASRQVVGLRYPGTGMLIHGRAAFVSDGPSYTTIKERFVWARAALVITIESSELTL